MARDGPRGLVHGNAGRRPANAIGVYVKQRAMGLSRTRYASFNDTHFAEKLAAFEGIHLSRETVRRTRRKAGILPKGCRITVFVFGHVSLIVVEDGFPNVPEFHNTPHPR